MVDEQLQLAIAAPRRPRPLQVAAPATRPGRPRARRSGPTCRAPCRARRSGAVSFGGTRTSSSPQPSSCRSSQRRQHAGSPRAPTTAPRRAPPPSRAARRCRPATVRSSSIRPASSTATAVNDCLCTSTPITIIRDRLHSRWGRPASGQTSIEARATLLSGHARRSRDGGGDTTLASQPSGDIRESSQPPPTRVCATHRTPPPTENDIEFGNDPRAVGSYSERAGTRGQGWRGQPQDRSPNGTVDPDSDDTP